MHKWKSIGIFCISGLIIVAAGTGVAATLALPYLPPIPLAKSEPFEWPSETLSESAVLSAEQIQEDTQILIRSVEETHPLFLKTPPEAYNSAKSTFLARAVKPMRLEDYQILVNTYMTSLQDGHTQVYWRENEWLEVEWQYENGQLYLIDEMGQVSKKTVANIMGKSVNELTEAADRLFPSENMPAKALNYEKYFRSKRFLKTQGIAVNEDISLEVDDQGKRVNLSVPFGYNQDLSGCKRRILGESLDAKTYYVLLETCVVNAQLENTIKGLKTAIEAGANRVIIDVRNNGGGNSDACEMLLEAMDMQPGKFGSVVRYSPMACKEYGLLQKKGRYVYQCSNEAKANPNIDLYVITNKETFSSAQWLATWVKDGKLGTVVGQPSSNKPSSFGDVLNFQLPNSKLIGGISYKQWLRPDQTRNDEAVLEPDVIVPTGEDPIRVIMALKK